MKVINPELLKTPRSVVCEYCGLYCRRPTERHHIIGRRMGGGSRLDIPENLIDLGSPWDCNCHERAGCGKITKAELWRIVARRMGTQAGLVRAKVMRLLRADKSGNY